MKTDIPQHLYGGCGRGRTRTGSVLVLLGLVIVAGLAPAGAETPATAPAAGSRSPSAPPALIRIGISPGTWQGLNRNDTTAAIAAWAKIVMGQRGIPLEVEARLFESAEEMSSALQSGRVDAVSMLADQFLALDPGLQPDAVFLSIKGQSFIEQYVLLVHQGSGITDIAGLRGRKLLLQSSARTSLAMPWLNGLLARQSLGPADEFLKTVSRSESPSKAVLPVFFRQADACLVTSNVFEMASELNPQLRKELRVLAVSPEVVPCLFYFRPGYVSSVRDQLEPAITDLHQTPAGLQVLTVFQADRMVKRPLSCFDGTRAMLREAVRSRPLHTLK